jgi:type II secretory pathway pseudopilin PulG
VIAGRGVSVAARAAGATLPALLMVAALLGILITLIGLNVSSFTTRTRAQAAATNLLSIRDGMLRVAVDCHGLPVWSGGGDPGLTTRPAAWGAACWRGPYLQHWPSSPGVYEFEGPGGAATAVVRIHSVPRDVFPTIAARIAAVFGANVFLRYDPARGWSAEIPVGGEYQAAQGR